MIVNEIFGPTFQGEGKYLGMPVVFLRLADCNLKCVWCDSRFSWDWSKFEPEAEAKKMTAEEVAARLQEMSPCTNLVISGGEPMIQQEEVYHLTTLLHKKKWFTQMETNGTIPPRTTELVRFYNVSPKLPNSGNVMSVRPDVLRMFNDTGRAIFKFVVQTAKDFDDIDALVKALGLSPVYIMPEGVTAGVVVQRMIELAPEVIRRGYFMTPRLHTLLYGARRGI